MGLSFGLELSTFCGGLLFDKLKSITKAHLGELRV